MRLPNNLKESPNHNYLINFPYSFATGTFADSAEFIDNVMEIKSRFQTVGHVYKNMGFPLRGWLHLSVCASRQDKHPILCFG